MSDLRSHAHTSHKTHEAPTAPATHVASAKPLVLDECAKAVDVYLHRIARYATLDDRSSILDVGIGTGWFLLGCAKRGFRSAGLELNPHHARRARDEAARFGLRVDVLDASVEENVLEANAYDAVFASSVFEHVPDYRLGLENVYRWLKTGGVLYFYSTNRFALRSGEFPAIPLYGALPQRMRLAIRTRMQRRPFAHSSGFDHNQFTHRGLERTFRDVGFSQVLDVIDLARGSELVQPRVWKSMVLAAGHFAPPVRTLVRTFSSGTTFICVK